MIEWRQKSNPEKNSLGPPTKPKIIPGPKFPERILKMLQHEIIPSEFIFSSSGSHWLYFIRRTTRPGYTGTTTIPRLFRIKPPKKILDKFSYPPKNTGIENFKPKKSFDHPRRWKSGVSPPRPPPRNVHSTCTFIFVTQHNIVLLGKIIMCPHTWRTYPVICNCFWPLCMAARKQPGSWTSSYILQSMCAGYGSRVFRIFEIWWSECSNWRGNLEHFARFIISVGSVCWKFAKRNSNVRFKFENSGHVWRRLTVIRTESSCLRN